MGLMDRMKEQAGQALTKAQQGVTQGKAKIEEAQAKHQWDTLLRNLGAAVWAEDAKADQRRSHGGAGRAGHPSGRSLLTRTARRGKRPDDNGRRPVRGRPSDEVPLTGDERGRRHWHTLNGVNTYASHV